MKKIPSLFVRDWDGDRSRVLDKVDPACSWVLAGEGRATVKVDGTACFLDEAEHWWKRYMVKKGKVPAEFIQCGDPDERTGKIAGWVPVGDGPGDQWFREAISRLSTSSSSFACDQTYELIGPKVQGNRYGLGAHELVEHGCEAADCPHDSFGSIREWLGQCKHEGVVWHHRDGRMAKIKRRDFGLAWPITEVTQ